MPRERSIGREGRCFIGPLRVQLREAVEARRHPCRQPAESSGVGGLAASVCSQAGRAREPGGGRLRRAGRSAAAVGRRELAFKGHATGPADRSGAELDGLQRAASRPGVPAQWPKPGMGLVASAARGGVGSGGRYDSAELVPLCVMR